MKRRRRVGARMLGQHVAAPSTSFGGTRVLAPSIANHVFALFLTHHANSPAGQLRAPPTEPNIPPESRVGNRVTTTTSALLSHPARRVRHLSASSSAVSTSKKGPRTVYCAPPCAPVVFMSLSSIRYGVRRFMKPVIRVPVSPPYAI